MTKYQKSYQKHKSERQAKSRDYYRRNREKRLSYNKEYREKNKDLVSKRFIAYYMEHKEELKEKSKEKYDRMCQSNGVKYMEYKALHPCVLCGESNSVVLQFHHKIPRGKNDNRVSTLITNRSSWDRIQKEIDKCIIVCANCHLIIHEQMKKYGTLFHLENFLRKEKTEQVITPTPSFLLNDCVKIE